ncbi:MAG: hypothetical protein J6V53_05790 [Alphaproteobacteria bacterium]|nr:hypothetical protein [Alphaproteobacteria bacterium]
MSGLYDEQAFVERESKCLGLSVLLHLFILGIMCFNFSWNTSEFEKSPPAILMVDLTNVKIADKTNLPPLIKETKKEEVKAPEVKKEEKKPEPPKPQPKKEEPKPLPPKENKTPPVKQEAPLPKPEPVKPKEQPKKEAVKVQEKKPEPKKEPKKEVKKKEPKKEVKKETPKPQSKPAPKVAPKPVPKKQNQGLQSLLASVEKVRKPANQAPSSAPASSGQTVNNGIKGGTEGSLLSDLTISEKDLIASKISSCWNVNAGVENADKMIVELRAFINKDGSVREVKILNMKSDPVFRSMAESAKRAIYVCDALKEDSPFRILANKRPEMYSSWKEIRLRMNPVDGGVY